MPAIIALAAIALAFILILALAVLGFTVHLLFSPWLWVAVIAIVAFVKFRPRSRR
jgi:hypothetical protein